MNFWDSTLTGGTGVATPPPDAGRQQTLNEEVTEVMGQLNRFWGGFRRQSQDAIQAARKDLGEVVAQAQKEFSKLSTAETPESSSRDPSVSTEGESSASASVSSSTTTLPEQPSSPSQSTNLFSRLQASLPPDLLSTLQSNLPDTIRHAPERLDLTQLRSTLQQVRVQDATVRGEELLRSAGVFLRDAVKVVPPDEGDVAREGADASSQPVRGHAKSKGKEASSVSTGDLKTIGTRRAALLQALRTNPAILKVDPANELNSEALYKTWEAKEVQSNDGGILGGNWKTRIEEELKEAGEGLTASRDSLVPSEITEDVFWTRYFFRVFQIEQEEERRKALLAGSSTQEEDFSWEDEDEEATSPTSTLPGRPDALSAEAAKNLVPVVKEASKPTSQAATPNTTSPPQSEASYDLVSATASTAGETPPPRKAEAQGDNRESDDDDDDDEEEESVDSDWE